MEKFDDQLPDEFAHSFYGYGNYAGDYWFVGMEEGGGDSFADVNKRLNVWKESGKRELEDVAGYHFELGITHLFEGKIKIQKTWRGLIRILFGYKDELPTTEQVREYQKKTLGRLDNETCLVELLPLPSPSTSHWLYAQHSQLSYLVNREKYKQKFLAWRIAHLQQRIKEYKPKAVIFYSFSYQDYWRQIAEQDFVTEFDGARFNHNKETVFAMIKHPVAHGVTSEYFYKVGKTISEKLNEK